MSQTGLKHAGGIYNEVRSTTGLTIYGFLGAAEKLCSFFCRQSPVRNPLKKRSDHSFYHRQTRNTRKQWTKNARGASVLERKRHESTQSAREDRPTSVGVVEAAGSSPVTQTNISYEMNKKSSQIVRFRLDFCLLCYCLFASTIPKMVWCIASASKLQVNRRLFQKNPNNYATRSPLTITKIRLNIVKIMQWCTA